MQQVEPMFRYLPYVTSVIEISDEVAKRLLATDTLPNPADLIQAGVHIVVSHGDFEKCHGIVRDKKDDTVMVDINYLGRMFAVQLPLSDVELPAGGNYWED